MYKTWKLSFSLKNTYRVNTILYGLKQIPLIKRLLPDKLYQIRGLKIFANVLSFLSELLSVFLGKFLYFLLMIMGMASLYEGVDPAEAFLHILLFLTIIGAYENTHLFNPSRDKYYAMFLMRMNARSYTLVNYGYAILKIVVGFLPFALFFGMQSQVPIWCCLMIPFFVAGSKLAAACLFLRKYEKRGTVYSENRLGIWLWGLMGSLVAAAYLPPAVGVVLPLEVTVGVMAVTILLIPAAVWKIFMFQHYRTVYQKMLYGMFDQMDQVSQAIQEQSHKVIAADADITSDKKGFEYLNELFIKRHRKILWRSAERIAAVCLITFGVVFAALLIKPQFQEPLNKMLLTFLPYFAFIMYSINRGTGFSRALFLNCDHSLLTYAFYKQPKFILKLFQIRLREIVKINLLPAGIIGCGLALLLFVSGGTPHPIYYGVLVVSIVCMSIFFSVHYLMLYYLLQPYNAGSEIKSGTYQLIMSATYLICFFLMRLEMDTLLFGILCIIFCIGYCFAACFLVYRFAPKTFRIRT